MLALPRVPTYCPVKTFTRCEVGVRVVIVAEPLTLVRFSHKAQLGIGAKAVVTKPAASPTFHFSDEFSEPFLTCRSNFALRPLT
jgi:hypothetical protein